MFAQAEGSNLDHGLTGGNVRVGLLSWPSWSWNRLGPATGLCGLIHVVGLGLASDGLVFSGVVFALRRAVGWSGNGGFPVFEAAVDVGGLPLGVVAVVGVFWRELTEDPQDLESKM